MTGYTLNNLKVTKGHHGRIVPELRGWGYLKILHPPFNFLPSREERE